MAWQDYTLWAILLLAGGAVVRWTLRRVDAARRGGCGSCGSEACPLRRKR